MVYDNSFIFIIGPGLELIVTVGDTGNIVMDFHNFPSGYFCKGDYRFLQMAGRDESREYYQNSAEHFCCFGNGGSVAVCPYNNRKNALFLIITPTKKPLHYSLLYWSGLLFIPIAYFVKLSKICG